MQTFCSVAILFVAIAVVQPVIVNCSCRIGSDKLKSYTRRRIEQLIDGRLLNSVYWPDEPLDAKLLGRSLGLNVTLAETHFREAGHASNETKVASNEIKHDQIAAAAANESQGALAIQELFVTCSVDRDRSYALTIDLELDNPFKVVDVRYKLAPQLVGAPRESGNADLPKRTSGSFRINQPQSSFLVQLSQRVRYDQCLGVNYVQLAPNVNYEIECVNCGEKEAENLDKIFAKRMKQFDTELDFMLSEKLLLGLQILLDQQRIELDMFAAEE